MTGQAQKQRGCEKMLPKSWYWRLTCVLFCFFLFVCLFLFIFFPHVSKLQLMLGLKWCCRGDKTHESYEKCLEMCLFHNPSLSFVLQGQCKTRSGTFLKVRKCCNWIKAPKIAVNHLRTFQHSHGSRLHSLLHSVVIISPWVKRKTRRLQMLQSCPLAVHFKQGVTEIYVK